MTLKSPSVRIVYRLKMAVSLGKITFMIYIGNREGFAHINHGL